MKEVRADAVMGAGRGGAGGARRRFSGCHALGGGVAGAERVESGEVRGRFSWPPRRATVCKKPSLHEKKWEKMNWCTELCERENE